MTKYTPDQLDPNESYRNGCGAVFKPKPGASDFWLVGAASIFADEMLAASNGELEVVEELPEGWARETGYLYRKAEGFPTYSIHDNGQIWVGAGMVQIATVTNPTEAAKLINQLIDGLEALKK